MGAQVTKSITISRLHNEGIGGKKSRLHNGGTGDKKYFNKSPT